MKQIEQLKEACALLEVSGASLTRGTAYLVRSGWAATAAHVVSTVGLGGRVILRFPSGERQATVSGIDTEVDCAVLRLDRPLNGVSPLPIGPGTTRGSKWEGYGFPQTLGRMGVVLEGDVLESEGEDPRHAPAVVLFSAHASSGAGAVIQGFSGSPLLSSGRLIGHLKATAHDERAMLGVLYCCPIRYVEALLPPEDRSARPQPPGTAYDPSWYIVREREETIALSYLEHPGQPLVVWGPERFGKTWFLNRLLQQVEQRDESSRRASLNLDRFERESLSSSNQFFREWARQMCDELDIDPAQAEKASARISSSKMNLNWLMGRVILPNIQGRLYLAIDRADAIIDHSLADDFFGLLRTWAEQGFDPPWDRLRLLLVTSTSPAHLNRNPYVSPFNLTEPIRLEEFNGAQIAELAHRYNVHSSDEDLARLQNLVGGHPYLVRLALYEASVRRSSLSASLDPSNLLFDEFLDHLRSRFLRQPELWDGFRHVLEGTPVKLDPEIGHQLLRAGLVVWQHETQTYRPRYRLYERIARGGGGL